LRTISGILVVLAIALAAGCGGGGYGSAPAASTTTTTVSAVPTRASAAAAYLAIATPANRTIDSINAQVTAAKAANSFPQAAAAMRRLAVEETAFQARLAHLSVPADASNALGQLDQAVGRTAETASEVASAFAASMPASDQVVAAYRQSLADSASAAGLLRARLGLSPPTS